MSIFQLQSQAENEKYKSHIVLLLQCAALELSVLDKGHFYGSGAPILTMVMAILDNASSVLSLLVIQASENTKNNRNIGIQSNAHDALRGSLTDVLEVHSAALDEYTNADNCVERALLGLLCAWVW
jgi:hypothetical protein